MYNFFIKYEENVMEDKLDINSILKANHNNPTKIGELNSKVIDILELDCYPRNILLTADRIYHCEKHKSEYKLVAVRLSYRGNLTLRTVFPLTEYKFKKEVNSKKLIPYY